jgi:hypothetical protein
VLVGGWNRFLVDHSERGVEDGALTISEGCADLRVVVVFEGNHDDSAADSLEFACEGATGLADAVR